MGCPFAFTKVPKKASEYTYENKSIGLSIPIKLHEDFDDALKST